MERFSTRRSSYIKNEVIPIVQDVFRIIDLAELAPSDFFTYGFLIDTGVIVNQGKALHEFKGLISRADVPLTPNEEKGYGQVSQSSIRGISWRIAPVERVTSLKYARGYGYKSFPLIQHSETSSIKQNRELLLGFFALNPEAFTRFSPDGELLPAYYVPLKDILLMK